MESAFWKDFWASAWRPANRGRSPCGRPSFSLRYVDFGKFVLEFSDSHLERLLRKTFAILGGINPGRKTKHLC